MYKEMSVRVILLHNVSLSQDPKGFTNAWDVQFTASHADN